MILSYHYSEKFSLRFDEFLGPVRSVVAKIMDRKTNGSLHSAVSVSMVYIVVEII